MWNLTLTAIAVAFCVVGGGAALGACDHVPVNVRVNTPSPDVSVRASDNVAAVGMVNGYDGYGNPAGWHVTGLASSRPKYQVQVSGLQRPGCFRPTEVVVDVGFSGPIEVTISSRYFLGSCEYESIRSHEFRHVDIMRKSVTAYRDEMAAVVASSVATLSEYTFTLPDAQRRILDHIQMSTRSVFDKMMRMSVEQNAALDTPENYRREQAVCSNW